MRQLADVSVQVNTRLKVLSERAGAITSVVTTILEVADQTNLLSLNAAIEAEKAGNYGRGFSVVAAEIRRLADRTAVATGDIEQIIKEMQIAVTASVKGMDTFSSEARRCVEVSDQVSGQLSEIIRKVQALAPHLEVVSDGMQSQTDAARQISDALAQLSSSVQQTAESLVESNRAIEQLNAVSQNLQSGVSRFTIQA
jgi:methyl-accepting chemotaxis protein WspA